jgi:hypothetical protein
LRLVVCVWVDRVDEGSDSPTTSGGRCLAVGKARINSIVPCTPILATGLSMDQMI